jgi:hypothetical protein
MDVVERLSLEAATEHTSQACEHIHRYEFAASLCHNMRVLDLEQSSRERSRGGQGPCHD